MPILTKVVMKPESWNEWFSMVQHILADTRCTCGVEVNGSDLRGVVGYKEVAVNCREHSHQRQWLNAQSDSQWEKGTHCGCLGEKHDTHDKQGHREEERILGDNIRNITPEELQIAIEEGVAHPCDTKDRNHGIHTRTKDVATDDMLHIGLAYNKNQGSY